MVKQSKTGEGSSNVYRAACAACKHQRRKCKEDCVMAPFFPTEKAKEYEAIHKLFGFSNMTKMLTSLDEQERKEAIKSFEWEALMWQQDPVFGPLGAFNKACDIITQLSNSNHETVQASLSNEVLSLPLSNYANWNSYVNGLQEPEILTCVPNPNGFQSRGGSLLQPHYVPSLSSIDLGQTSQIGMQRSGQGSECNVASVYSNGHLQRDLGGAFPLENNSVIQSGTDYAMEQSRVRIQNTDFQQACFYHLHGQSRVKQE